MKKGDLVYEGKAKKVFLTDREDAYLVEYKDDATAFNGKKHAQIQGKGVLNNRISTLIFKYLEAAGIHTHFLEGVSDREMLVQRVKILPIEVVTRNLVAGSLAKRLGLEEGIKLSEPVVEFYLKNDELNDPFINKAHAHVLGLATREQLEKLENTALRINDLLQQLLRPKKILLVDFKIEPGSLPTGEVILADEISPDTCRFWDMESMEKLDKDRFRRDLGGLTEAYEEILRRLEN